MADCLLCNVHHTMSYSTLATTLWVCLLGLATPSLAQGQTLTSHDIYLSHLSPMVRYLPTSTSDDIPTGWNVTLESHNASRTGASVDFGFFGRTFEVWGNGSNYDWTMTNKGDAESQYAASQETGEPATLRLLSDFDLDWHDVTLRINETERSYMDIRGFMLRTFLPQLDGRYDVMHRSAPDMHEFYRNADPAEVWETMESLSNQTTDMPFTSVYTEPPPEGGRYPFNSTVLSTNQTGQRFYFEMPRGASIVQLYGTVGPDQGEYEIRLIPTRRSVTEQDVQFTPHPYNQTFTGERPIDANLQVMYYGWLDPRVSYAMEVELLEEGKQVGIHGASFWMSTEFQPELDDWYPEDSNSGLSGGQIAGIVIGSVAGSALIGLAIWFFVRRRNRAKPAQTPGGKEDVESRST